MDQTYEVLRNQRIQMPTGDDAQSQNTRDMFLDFQEKGYVEEDSPGVVRWTPEGIRFMMANLKPF
jgi:hypothetical protein